MSSAFNLKFWGVRGSVPAPGASTVHYGGNTTCVEVQAGSQVIILDAGTGIRLLGKSLKEAGAQTPSELTLLLTHTHWDHIQGLPFFIPQLAPASRLRIFGCEGARESLATLLARQMESPFFPVPMRGFNAEIEIEEVTDSELSLGPVRVQLLRANHPSSCVGYRLEYEGRAIAFFPDNEPYLGKLRHADIPEDDPQARKARASHAAMVDFLQDIDVLVMDSQYDSAEYQTHIGWGHGCVDDVVSLAVESGARHLVLFHHDPDHDDHRIESMTETARALAREAGASVRIDAAREGASIHLAVSNV